MKTENGFAPIIVILAIAAVLAVGAGVTAFVYVTNNTSPNLSSSAYSPAIQTINVPNPDKTSAGFKSKEPTDNVVSPSPKVIVNPPPTNPTTPLLGQIDTSVSLSADKKTATVIFKSSTNFRSVSTIEYNLTYDSNGVKRGVQGNISMVQETIGPEIRKEIVLGTCSGGTCVYDTNPINFRLAVSTKL